MKYTENSKCHTANSVKMYLQILLLFILLLFLIGITNIVFSTNEINLTIPLFIVFVVIGVLVYRKMVVEYNYTCDEKKLVIDQVAGRKIKTVCEIRLKDIVQTTQIDNKHTLYKKARKYYAGKSENLYQIVSMKDGQETAIILKVSDLFVDKLNKMCG